MSVTCFITLSALQRLCGSITIAIFCAVSYHLTCCITFIDGNF